MNIYHSVPSNGNAVHHEVNEFRKIFGVLSDPNPKTGEKTEYVARQLELDF